MAYYVFMDNSNVWIEGKFASAVAKGLAPDVYAAHDTKTEDYSWRIDYGKVLNYVTDGHTADIKSAIMFGSKPPETDSIWNAAKLASFDVKTKDRNVANKEKAVDTGIVQEIARCLYKESAPGDIFVLVMGDKDFIPSVEAIKDEGRVAKVAFWSNVSGDLAREADEYIDLTPDINKITL